MPQYLLAVTLDADDASSTEMTMEEMQPVFEAVEAFNADVREAGAWVFAGGLHPREVSTVVDGTGAEPVVTPGPASDARHYLGGMWVIEAPDLDGALEWARRGAVACGGLVEVRPFQDEG